MKDLVNKSVLHKVLCKKDLEEDLDDIFESAQKYLNSLIIEKHREKKNKKRIKNNDDKKESISLRSVMSDVQIANLPCWVRDNADEAIIIGRSKKVIQIPDGRKYHIDNRLNHMSGGEWTYSLTSVINTRYPTSGAESYAHDIRKIHPSPKPPQLMADIIRFFTKPNEYILDYFMGVGGTLLGASMEGRRALGIDLEQKYIDAYKAAATRLDLRLQECIVGDSIELLSDSCKMSSVLQGEELSLILIDPPYGDMMARPKTGEAVKKKKSTEATPFTNLDTDLGNLDWPEFRHLFKQSVIDAADFLKQSGHIIVFIKDLQPKQNQTNLLHADLIQDLSSIPSISYIGTKIWADHSVNLYPYGYPYSFVSNQIHQYILIFKKVSK
jgi:DNA modification methylase